jgi:6-phosphofructokinase 1
MSPTRIPSGFDDPIISERLFLNQLLDLGEGFPEVECADECNIPNDCDERKLGKYRRLDEVRFVTTDAKIIERCKNEDRPVPTFLVAGPRKNLAYNAKSVKAAIVTTGGSAPGLNCVIHSIVKRHYDTYSLSRDGEIYGVTESFLGMCDLDRYMIPLKPAETEKWLERGGSMLGMRRFQSMSRNDLARKIVDELYRHEIDILYVIGGDGSLSTAHEIAKQRAQDRSENRGRPTTVVGIPKTMDNDVMWVSESFGFKTAVEKATEIINTLNAEAESSRRVCLIELFGAESGYVAAHSTLASGHVDLVLIPEAFLGLSKNQCEDAMNTYLNYLKRRVEKRRDNEQPHAVVVLAEGTAKILKQKGVEIDGIAVDDDNESGLLLQLKNFLKAANLKDRRENEIGVFFNRPRHYIRASPANAQDKIYCEQLGALAVDSALAGYTDFMLSQWLTSYVLVPLELVADRHKRIPTSTIFWKQVVNSTRQPNIEFEDVTRWIRNVDIYIERSTRFA